MFWKSASETEKIEKRLNQINELLKRSFGNVKKDTTYLFQWMNYFYKKSLEQEQVIKRLQMELSYMPRTREEIRKIIDDYYAFESVMNRIRELDSKVEQLSRRQIEYAPPIVEPKTDSVKIIQSEIPQQIDISRIEKRLEKLEQRKLSIKEKIIKKLTRNSKEYVKGWIMSYIKKYEKISALQLKEMIVDEQNFCSKSSFYRLLEEVEESDEIGVIKQGKEKQYFSKVMKKV